MKYIIVFEDEGLQPFYAGRAGDGSLGWAPTPATAMEFDTVEAAETLMRNGYGKLAEIGAVVEVPE